MQFIQVLEKEGLNFFTQKPLPSTKYHQAIVKSWEKIFDIDTIYPYDDVPLKHRKIQATFWVLKKEWVTNHQIITGKGKIIKS